MSQHEKTKPIMVISPDSVSADDIKKLEDNGVCVVVSKKPHDDVIFLDPMLRIFPPTPQ